MRIPMALYGLAFVVRALLFALHPDAAYPDSYYYVDVARALQAGHGFNIDFIWSFVDVGGRIPANPTLPIPSNAHWMPLASIVQLPTMWLLGPTQLASAIPFLLIGALAAPLTWLIAREIGAGDRIAMAAGVAVAIPGAAAIYMAQPDNFSLYQPLGLAAMWLAARGLRGHRGSFALAGLAVGLATLARNDGILLGATVGLAFVWDRWRAWRSGGGRAPKIPWRYAFACLGLFVVVMAPWYLRQLAVFGSFSPSSTSGRILLIANYEQLNSVTSDTSLGAFLGQGIGPLVTSRVLGLVSAIQIYSVLACSVVLVPFVVVGAWSRRRSVDFGPFFLYAGLLFGASALLFAVHVPYGTFLHSAVALVPFTFILGMEGVVIVVTWIARHRRGWEEERAARMFLIAAVGTLVLNAAAFGLLVNKSWNAERDALISAGQAIDAAGARTSDLVLSADPGGIEYFTGRGGVMTPDDSLDVIHRVATAYGVRWLVLQRSQIVAAMAPVLESKGRPAWIGPQIYALPYDGPKTGDSAADAAPAMAVYPVCTTASDTRCLGVARAGP
ncbi:MAG TPA: glycosyltransferase family 39 protein [Candidatus Limnocylindrales bacterium]